MVISVDLAARRWEDNGIALLWQEGDRVGVRLVAPAALGLRGTPAAEPFADALVALAEAEGARLMLLDGPQGWRAEQSELVHLRHCEKETRAPGKTGLPGVVKPATWTRMAVFCVELFDALHARGWPRFTRGWAGERAAIESFPTHAWRVLGEPVLPAKGKTVDLTPWVRSLLSCGVAMPPACTHDELQAVVGGLAGIRLLQAGLRACDLRGREPVVEAGQWREGYIVSATL